MNRWSDVHETPAAAVDAEKTALRNRLFTARSQLSESFRNDSGRHIRDTLLELPQLGAAGTVAAYYSVGSEPPTGSLIYALWKRGTYVVLPVLLPDGDLDWASYEGPDSLVPGRFGLLEPGEARRGTDTVAR
ncbi:MAG: 5-formyltetrahydrofolate cyclo-ligase, partial [Trebonia sp.]